MKKTQSLSYLLRLVLITEFSLVTGPSNSFCLNYFPQGEKYKFPLTLSLVGIRGEPKGIKATIYNLEEAMEVGAFFHINPLSWLVPEGEKKKKRSYKVNPDLLIENYHLDYILKKCGWEILISWLVLDRRPNKTDIVGIRIFKEIRCMEQIENVLNSDTVLKHFSEKDEVEA